MAKNDKVKEELAESRHDDVIGVMLGTFGFGALSVAIAYGLWQGLWAFLGMMLIIGIGFVVIWNKASYKRQSRKKLIGQLGNKK